MHDRVSKLTKESVARRMESCSTLSSFLDESRSLHKRLWEVCTQSFPTLSVCSILCLQIASEMHATELQSFREAIWEDSLMIILVFYEMLTSKADLREVVKLQGTKAQWMLDLMQNVNQVFIYGCFRF